MSLLVPPRRNDPEWMDRPDNPAPEVAAVLRDLETVNRLLGGTRAVLLGIRPHLLAMPPDRPLRVLDIGTGRGDHPRSLVRMARRLGRRIEITAVDRDPAIAAIAAGVCRSKPEIRVLCADALRLPFENRRFDVVTASMVLHHMDDEEAVRMVGAMRHAARHAVVVHDLRRNLVPWTLFGMAGALGRLHPMAREDGRLSILKGFTPAELLAIAHASGGEGAVVVRRLPYRLVLSMPGAGE